ncbi:MAG: hypothetical protein WC152_00945 [Candidatus Izemoplasmatales bacterium]
MDIPNRLKVFLFILTPPKGTSASKIIYGRILCDFVDCFVL